MLEQVGARDSYTLSSGRWGRYPLLLETLFTRIRCPILS